MTEPAIDQSADGEHHGPTVRDRRRIDPDTYQVREPQPAAAPGPALSTMPPHPRSKESQK